MHDLRLGKRRKAAVPRRAFRNNEKRETDEALCTSASKLCAIAFCLSEFRPDLVAGISKTLETSGLIGGSPAERPGVNRGVP